MSVNYHPKRPLALLELMPPLPFSAVGSTLQIWDASEETIRVADPTEDPYHLTTRLFDLTTYRYILRYTTEPKRSGWTIEIKGDRPAFTVEYAFSSRTVAFEFQKYITGYTCDDNRFAENIQCDATIEGKFLGLGSKNYSGVGEIQLWLPPEELSGDNGGGMLGDTASIRTATTIASTLAPRISHQSHGNTSSFVNLTRTPLIMMFLRERSEGRTMLRINCKSTSSLTFVCGD